MSYLFKKKPVTIEAMPWTGKNMSEIKAFVGDVAKFDILDTAWEVGKGTPYVFLSIETLEGTMKAKPGDFIIKGVNGEFYPCDGKIFDKTYEWTGLDNLGNECQVIVIKEE